MLVEMGLFWHLNCILVLNWIVWNKTVFTFNSVYCLVSWGCRIQHMLLRRGVRSTTPPHECPVYDTKQSDDEVPVMLEFWGIQSTPSLPLLPGPLCPGVVVPDRFLSMGQIQLNCVLMLNWIAWNRTVLTFKLHTYAKLNCLKWNCFCMLNWIVWNRTVLSFNCV